MTIALNHTIVRVGDRATGAGFLADLLGLPVGAPAGPFIPVRVNDELTLDFDDRGPAVACHLGFLVDDETFDALLGRLVDRSAVSFGAGPEHGWDRRINRLAGGRGLYVGDPDGHTYEFFTVVPD
ncbi:VOC family protein [Pseudonocardia sp. KRD291]|uniref:VOC family protein n=1 Tax=Pseudonocardia sp. KRD291 TaxID=2792007 RepID=UPI001C4A1949|nr:VOC family protein [Pseudonocardia sp. KRD291]MBW0104532.1 VOC family protein [Pseudonocardia sp. KRD291]